MIGRIFRKLSERAEEKRVGRLTLPPIVPVYHFHIRKTGGTTINFAFLNALSDRNTDELYEELAGKYNNRIINNDKVLVGWNRKLINEGKYNYAFSHIPYHLLELPERVFRFTCLRDPSNRVISHYNMLMYYQEQRIDHPCMKTEGPWLGNTFSDFLKRIPREHLQNQLYMFSRNFNLSEATDNIRTLDMTFTTEELSAGMARLSKATGYDLKVSQQKKYDKKYPVTDSERKRLREMLEEEYGIFDQLKISIPKPE